MLEEENENLDTEDEEMSFDENDNLVQENEYDKEFERDEDGNIIIPDIEDEIDDTLDEFEEEPKEEEEKPQTKETSEETQKEASIESEKETQESQAQESVNQEASLKDQKIAELEEKLAKLTLQGKETLTKLGIETEDVAEGLEKLAAETEDISLDEYRKKKEESLKQTQSQEAYNKIQFENRLKTDFEKLTMTHPELKEKSSIREIPNFIKYAKLRDMGISAEDAYLVANPSAAINQAVAGAKQSNLNDTKSHLKSVVPQGTKDNSIRMPKETLNEWRDLFPDKTDREIVELYKNTI